ncbi:DNA circularization N-terminal domain-containing protein [Rhodoferax sp. BLA1]|uniref:DNA circularization N-terminal domain-containing protein n=1 Tax=Rhodoferax sp. BLA1 TaxID=2576062 RepID=UPI0015D35F38|nr:DNA circularization N-terminal domain-containing protein [Rhodoferax sp. BLA1]
MSWRTRLKPARWDGLEFLTDSHTAKGGRRLVVSEYPGRDDVEVEDLGAKANGWQVNAYFLGDDYDLDRNSFLEQLQVPGPVWLLHPWLGYVWVRAQDWTLTESNADGGYARVAVDLVPGGGEAPQPEPDVADAAEESVQSYAAAASDYKPPALPGNSVATFLARIQGAMGDVRNALARARMPLTMLAAVLNTVDSARALLAQVLELPGAYATALRSIGGALGLSDADLTDGARVRVVAALTRSAVAPGAAITAGALGAGDSPALRRALAAEQTARGHWLVATAMQVALADYTTVGARDTALQLVLSALDELLPGADDGVFESAVDARLRLQQALSLQALEATQTRQVVAAMPATVLAYRMQVDEAALVERNAVRHPLFVRGQIDG